jgi:hypothetical protein
VFPQATFSDLAKCISQASLSVFQRVEDVIEQSVQSPYDLYHLMDQIGQRVLQESLDPLDPLPQGATQISVTSDSVLGKWLRRFFIDWNGLESLCLADLYTAWISWTQVRDSTSSPALLGNGKLLFPRKGQMPMVSVQNATDYLDLQIEASQLNSSGGINLNQYALNSKTRIQTNDLNEIHSNLKSIQSQFIDLPKVHYALYVQFDSVYDFVVWKPLIQGPTWWLGILRLDNFHPWRLFLCLSSKQMASFCFQL